MVPDPNHLLPDGKVNGNTYTHGSTGNAFVSEGTATVLQPGWNIITRNILNQVRAFLIFDDIQPPSFQLTHINPGVIHLADLAAGTVVTIQGFVTDNFTGTASFVLLVRLNDPKHIGPLHTKIDPATGKSINVVTLTFAIADLTGNTTTVNIDLTIT
jgi:hypothetical protein